MADNEHNDGDLFVWDDLKPPRRPREELPARTGKFDEAVRRFASDLEAPAAADRPDEEWEEWREPGAGEPGLREPEPLEARAQRPPGAQRSPSPPGLHRRRSSARAVLAAMLIGFFVAGLLDAGGLEADVKAMQLGTAGRSVRLALLKPIVLLSGALRLGRPAEALNAALGRGEGQHHSLAEVKTKAKPKWPRDITAERPLRLYIVGDSMAKVFGSSLKNLGEGTDLVKAKVEDRNSTGLTRPDYFDWPQRLIDQLVDWNPDATAVLFGANDAQSVLYEGKVLKVGTKAWQEVYQQRVGEAMVILTRGGRRVYWVGNPIMRDALYRGRIAMMNHIYEAEAKKHPGVTFVSTWKLMANDKGSYAEYLRVDGGDNVLMRAPDGIHLSTAGGDRMAGVVLAAIQRDWGMPAAQ